MVVVVIEGDIVGVGDFIDGSSTSGDGRSGSGIGG